MKKIISVIVSCVLVASAGVASFADDTGAFSDIQGTPYEAAAAYLAEEGILNGFPDGSFRPDQSISRAEACTLVSKMMDATEAELEASAASAAAAFSDVTEDNWFAPYIGYCATEGFVIGYTDGTVQPQQQISFNEFVTMICRVAGDTDSSLGGTWPSNYIESAQERGLLEGLSDFDVQTEGADPLDRGNAAIIAYNYELSWESGEEPGGSEEPDPEDNPMESFSGRALGIVTETGTALNDDGDEVGCITFMMGENTYELLTSASAKDVVSKCQDTDALVYLQMRRGEVRDIIPITSATENADGIRYILTSSDAGGEAEEPLEFARVKRSDGAFVRYYGDGGTEGYFNLEDGNCVVYTCAPDGDSLKYDRGSAADIYEGCYVVAYTVDEDSQGLANVVIVIDADDADELLAPAAEEDSSAPRSFL